MRLSYETFGISKRITVKLHLLLIQAKTQDKPLTEICIIPLDTGGYLQFICIFFVLTILTLYLALIFQGASTFRALDSDKFQSIPKGRDTSHRLTQNPYYRPAILSASRSAKFSISSYLAICCNHFSGILSSP